MERKGERIMLATVKLIEVIENHPRSMYAVSLDGGVVALIWICNDLRSGYEFQMEVEDLKQRLMNVTSGYEYICAVADKRSCRLRF
jgi:hypothetical protein